jgi:hypothetical protein
VRHAATHTPEDALSSVGGELSSEHLPRLEFEKVLRADAAEIISAHEKAQIIHRGRNIDAAGDEVEVATRRVIRRKLPNSYYVGHGHIVDAQLNQSPQVDVVIADNSEAPILFATENGTEYFPYESVYAIGEVKSTYYRSRNDVEAFVNTVARIKSQLNREPTPPTYMGSGINMNFLHARLSANVPYRNPLFNFTILVKGGNEFRPDDLVELYASRPVKELPNIVCFLDRGVLVYGQIATGDGGQEFTLSPVPEWVPDPEPNSEERYRWVFNEFDPAVSFGNLYLTLLIHLSRSQLYSPDLMKYLHSFLSAGMGRYWTLT